MCTDRERCIVLLGGAVYRSAAADLHDKKKTHSGSLADEPLGDANNGIAFGALRSTFIKMMNINAPIDLSNTKKMCLSDGRIGTFRKQVLPEWMEGNARNTATGTVVEMSALSLDCTTLNAADLIFPLFFFDLFLVVFPSAAGVVAGVIQSTTIAAPPPSFHVNVLAVVLMCASERIKRRSVSLKRPFVFLGFFFVVVGGVFR
jgi:hypothetical protein